MTEEKRYAWPRTVGPYTIVQGGRLGTGSFGRVFSGIDPRSNTFVAVKFVILAAAESPGPDDMTCMALEDFREECRVAQVMGAARVGPAIFLVGACDAKGVVTDLPCSWTGGNIIGVIVMEAYHRSLEDFRLSRRAFWRVRDLLEPVVSRMIETNIYHNDLTPKNIMINFDGDGDPAQLRLIDWAFTCPCEWVARAPFDKGAMCQSLMLKFDKEMREIMDMWVPILRSRDRRDFDQF